MKLKEFINLYKPFELEVKKDEDKILDYQLEKYFVLDDIKIEKGKEIIFYGLYKHKKSGEIIKIKIDTIEENNKHNYRNFNNDDAVKDVIARKIPLQVGEEGVEFELLGGNNETK